MPEEQIADLHLSVFNPHLAENFRRYVAEDLPLTRAAFTLVAGDITTGHAKNYTIPMNAKQQIEEWEFVEAPTTSPAANEPHTHTHTRHAQTGRTRAC